MGPFWKFSSAPQLLPIVLVSHSLVLTIPYHMTLEIVSLAPKTDILPCKDFMSCQNNPLPTSLLLSPIQTFRELVNVCLQSNLVKTSVLQITKLEQTLLVKRARVALSNPQQLELLKTCNELQCKSTVFSLKRCKHILLFLFSWQWRQNLLS